MQAQDSLESPGFPIFPHHLGRSLLRDGDLPRMALEAVVSFTFIIQFISHLVLLLLGNLDEFPLAGGSD